MKKYCKRGKSNNELAGKQGNETTTMKQKLCLFINYVISGYLMTILYLPCYA